VTIFLVNSSTKAQMHESFPLGLRGIEGVTLIISFYFIQVTPPCPLLPPRGGFKTVMPLTEVKYNYP
jgi:hypothetical protein